LIECQEAIVGIAMRGQFNWSGGFFGGEVFAALGLDSFPFGLELGAGRIDFGFPDGIGGGAEDGEEDDDGDPEGFVEAAGEFVVAAAHEVEELDEPEDAVKNEAEEYYKEEHIHGSLHVDG
jgi:hypothetical protein